MTNYQLYMRLRHFFIARHYRGHGIHSPYLYDFVRNVLMRSSLSRLAATIEAYYVCKVVVVDCVADIPPESYIVILSRPFVDRLEYECWSRWRAENSCLSVWLNGCVVLFFDERLQNQHFNIRS